MGNKGSRIINRITQPIREYNLQDRAHKAVIKNKDVPSPKHPSTQQLIESSIQRLPEHVKQDLSHEDLKFGERLQKVFVTSQDVTPIEPISRNNPDRPLPSHRGHVTTPEYGFHEPKKIPYGKVTLSNALAFITKHYEQKEKYLAENIALEYKLDITLTGEVLKHFGTFRLMMPTDATQDQTDKLKYLDASPTFLPNTKEIRQILDSIAMKNKPMNDGDPVPLEAVLTNKPSELQEGDRTLLHPLGLKIKVSVSEPVPDITLPADSDSVHADKSASKTESNESNKNVNI